MHSLRSTATFLAAVILLAFLFTGHVSAFQGDGDPRIPSRIYAPVKEKSFSGEPVSQKSKGYTVGDLLFLQTLYNLNVKSANLDWIGEIVNLLLDPESGEIAYAVMVKGSHLEIGTQGFLVPWEMLTIHPDGKFVELDITYDVEAAQAFDLLGDEEYRNAGYDKGVPGYAGGETLREGYYVHSSSYETAMVKDGSGNDIGRIQSIVVDPEREVLSLVVINPAAVTTHPLAVPFASLSWSEEGNYLVLPFSQKRMKNAPELTTDMAGFTAQEAQRIYTHFGIAYPKGE